MTSPAKFLFAVRDDEGPVSWADPMELDYLASLPELVVIDAAAWSGAGHLTDEDTFWGISEQHGLSQSDEYVYESAYGESLGVVVGRLRASPEFTQDDSIVTVLE